MYAVRRQNASISTWVLVVHARWKHVHTLLPNFMNVCVCVHGCQALASPNLLLHFPVLIYPFCSGRRRLLHPKGYHIGVREALTVYFVSVRVDLASGLPVIFIVVVASDSSGFPQGVTVCFPRNY